MTFQDVLEELEKMTVDEQLRLMEALSQRLQKSVRQASAANVGGIFGQTRDISDEEIKDMIADALIEKYK